MANPPKVNALVSATEIEQAKAEQFRLFVEAFGPVTEDSSPEVKEAYAAMFG